MPSPPTLSVVIPIHNEAAYLTGAVEDLYRELDEVPAGVDIVLVENGSTDATPALAAELASRHDNLEALTLPDPDYGGAMRQGFLAATGEWVVGFDIDYYSGEFLRTVIAIGDDADVVLASKRAPGSEDRRSLFRRIATWGFNLVLRTVLSSGVSDTHGMKAIRRDVVAAVGPAVISREDLFDTELVIRAERAGARIIEVPVVVEEKRQARSSLLRRVPRTLRGVWRIRRQLRREG